MASIFTLRRQRPMRELLDQVPATGPPVVVVHRSAGEVVGAKVDEMVRSSNRVVDLECELGRAREKLREDQLELAEAIKLLGMPMDVLSTLQSRRDG